MKLPENVSESVKKRNPHLYGGGLGAVPAAQSKQASVSTLDSGVQSAEAGTSRVEIRVSLVVFRRKLTDSDNNVASLKSLRDGIAESLGIDDGDERITFDCYQLKTAGQQGVIVLIEANGA